MGQLQERGLIAGHRGHVQIVNEAGLRKQACECYPIIDMYYKNIYR